MRLSKLCRSTPLVALLFSLSPALAKNDKEAPTDDRSRVHHDFLVAPPRAATDQKEAAPAPDPLPPKKVAPAFSKGENEVVRDYFLRHPAKGAALPEHLAKEYARGKPLPFGVEIKELPWGLMKRLALRLGHQYRQVGRDVVIIDSDTLTVIDILKDVFS